MTPTTDDSQQPPVQRISRTASAHRGTTVAASRDSRNAANEIGKSLLLGTFVLAIGVALFFHIKSATFINLMSADAIDAAQVAYNYRMHRTLATRVIYPIVLAGSRPDTKGQDIGRPPLYQMLLGMFFKSRGMSDDAVVMFNALCLFALAWVMYAIMLVAFDKSTAVWAVLGYFCSLPVLAMALAANGSLLTTLFFSLALLFGLHIIRQNQTASGSAPPNEATSQPPFPWLWVLGIGLAAGLAYLSGYFSPLIWVALAVICTAVLGPARRKAAIVVFAAAFAIGGLWWLRNIIVLGTPWSPLQQYQLLCGTREYPGNSILWTMSGAPDNPVLYLLSHFGELARKIAGNFVGVYRAVPDMTERYLFPFLIGGLLWLPKTAERRFLWAAFFSVLFIQAGTSLVTTASDADLGLLRPLATCLAVAALVQWLRSVQLKRRFRLLAGLIAIAIVMVPYAERLARQAQARPIPTIGTLTQVSRYFEIPNNAVFATDNPWVVAWYGRYRAALLPQDPKDLAAMVRMTARQPHIMYITLNLKQRESTNDGPWTQLLSDFEQVRKMGLPLRVDYGTGRSELLVLTPEGSKVLTERGRNRWQAAFQSMMETMTEAGSPPAR